MASGGPTDDIEPAPPYEPPNRFSNIHHGPGPSDFGRGSHPAPNNFLFNRATYPELPGFYDEYGHDQFKMMELNSKHKAKMRRQLHQHNTTELATVRTRSSGSKLGLIFFFVLSLVIVGGFVALVFYVISSRS
ncbi:uncharacterized protein [Mytilus edulis]|uniref:uncharacterized protein n=1 Tax=Mytilus edulis TaxID=6550 RepID=UPI0039F086D6